MKDMNSAKATEIAAVIALCGVMLSAIVAYVTSSRSVYVNAVTTARIRWMEKVRKLIIDFREEHLMMCLARTTGKTGTPEASFSLNKKYEVLCLSLGRSTCEEHIQRLASHCLANIGEYDNALGYSQHLRAHGKWLLDMEWMRVKHEASSVVMSPYRKWKLFEKETAYLYFAEREGAYEDQGVTRETLFKLRPPASLTSAAHP